MNLHDLQAQHCHPRKGPEHQIAAERRVELLALLPGWSLAAEGTEIRKDFRFPDFYKTIAFVNALAWMANREDHHPDLEVGYGHCLVRWSTHDVGGLSMNDFVCAAKVEALAG